MSQTPTKVSSAELFARLDELQERLRALDQISRLGLAPEATYVYKPRKDGSGTALKLDLRLDPTISEKGFITAVEGGLFMELAAQGANGADGFARFDWTDSRITVKLGLVDVLAILAGYRQVRLLGKKTPASTRMRDDQTGTSVSMFHKFGSETASITVQFEADRSQWRVSKSKDVYRSIYLSLQEEIQVETYLRLALEGILRVGA